MEHKKLGNNFEEIIDRMLKKGWKINGDRRQRAKPPCIHFVWNARYKGSYIRASCTAFKDGTYEMRWNKGVVQQDLLRWMKEWVEQNMTYEEMRAFWKEKTGRTK